MTIEIKVGSIFYTVTQEFADGINAMLQGYLQEHKINELIEKEKEEEKTVRNPIWVTEDGAKYYEPGYTIYGVNSNSWTVIDTVLGKMDGIRSESVYKWFSSPENRQEYIEYNKPVLSQKEVNDLLIVNEYEEVTINYRERIKCALDTYVMEKMSKKQYESKQLQKA